MALQIGTWQNVDVIAFDFARSTLLKERHKAPGSPKIERLECSTARQKVTLQLVAQNSSACTAAIHASSIAESGCPTCCACSNTVTEQIRTERARGYDAKLTLIRIITTFRNRCGAL